ncbi:hypothetical protein ACWT_1418 [Actinoplanes sp. SE50]|uniref:hypothetical protein n=1 Tax=unclassified Actinoplanes TaxID=2626549 RepID=UPI00023EC20C|nr:MULTISPECIES: hypothetical protein [unclassified Actinoplanes]AEV82436.1 hypothetical protein ACPL_1539 [Actinoplanes sp. SE50/110]ATO80833.1 hypothetical protein ACWT_1418 [Actinoplanes sp. SE50]SLL98240.1 hypothetical protein ACSP50_1465 [Actinoplanes sp. SE50/110]
MNTELYIGADAEKVVVAGRPVRTRTGRARSRRTGSMVEAVPCPPSGRSREVRVTNTARLALPLLFVAAVLAAAGLTWWLPAAGGTALVVWLWRRQARAAQPVAFRRPGEGEGRVLWTEPERAAFTRAVAVAHRVRRTWPALGAMIDTRLADRSLTRALDELATLLARRQELRRVRAGLAATEDADIPADSPARIAADLQRERADELWRETGAAANRIIRAIDAAARTGESFIREQQVAATARHAERTLARVGGVPVAESGPELADRTAAVITAYRELGV